VAVFRDVSEQKRAEELSRRLSSAVEETTDAVFITDRDGKIEYVNDAFETITGYSRAQAVGQTPRILKSGKQHPDYYANLWAALLKGQSFRASVINRKRGGELFHARQTITPLRDRAGGKITSFVSLLTDLTEHMIFEEKAIEMRLAAKVQRQTFPQKPPRVSGFDIGGTVSPALETCGDYYDFLALPDGRLGITIADACGHGVGPALIMAETRAMVRLLARTGREPADVLAEVNESLAADLSAGHYVTMILAWLDPRSGELQWANAGHPPGLVLSKTGSVRERLRCTGIPLGLFADRRYGAGQKVVLGPGESLLLMTDGITETESPDGTQLDVGAVIDFFREHRHEPAPEILDRLHRFVGEFAAGQPQKDDLTSVICKRTDDRHAG
jgi:sigma-B regulation protein RsbU (phosphoserine phosphatase)